MAFHSPQENNITLLPDNRPHISTQLLENHLQAFRVSYLDSQFQMLMAQVQLEGRVTNLVLPLTINKFFLFKNINESIFREQPSSHKVHSARYSVSPLVLQQPDLFLYFIPFLIKLQNRDQNILKYGVAFHFQQKKYFLKIIYSKYQRKACF